MADRIRQTLPTPIVRVWFNSGLGLPQCNPNVAPIWARGFSSSKSNPQPSQLRNWNLTKAPNPKPRIQETPDPIPRTTCSRASPNGSNSDIHNNSSNKNSRQITVVIVVGIILIVRRTIVLKRIVAIVLVRVTITS